MRTAITARRSSVPAARAGVLLLACATLLASCARQDNALVPEARLRSAWSDFILGEYKQSIRKFESTRADTAGQDELHLQALYGLATVWNTRLPLPGQDKEKAAALYRRIIERAPDHDLAAWSRQGLARIVHLVPTGVTPDYEAVRAAYQDVIEHHPGHLAAQEACIFQQATLLATLDPGDAARGRDALLAFIEQHPDSGFVSPAYSMLSVAYATLNDHEKRLWAEIESFKRVEVDPENPDQDHSWRYWNIATIAEFAVGDFETAREYYNKLIASFPTDARMYAAEQALERMDALEAEMRRKLAEPNTERSTSNIERRSAEPFDVGRSTLNVRRWEQGI